MIGTTVGKYRILERLGRGGMGIVYKAIDETLDREVAIKVLNPDFADADLLKRFRAEAVSLARLNHPNIATIYELHRHDEDLLMVMEFVRGETLQTLSERLGPLEPPQAAHVCVQILDALAHAHRAGIVHRDLKPANVMLTDSGMVKVMDFGIARMLGGEHFTHAGYMMGTPAYMAPEQVLGQEIDGRADLYSVSVLFYRLLSRQLPFQADTAISMAQKQVAEAPTPIGTFRPDLPVWCESIISKALAKSPSARYQTAEAFRTAILSAVTPATLGDLPTMATPTVAIRQNTSARTTPESLAAAPTITSPVQGMAARPPAGPSLAASSGAATPGTGAKSPVERTGTTLVLGRGHLVALTAVLVVLIAGIAALGFAAFKRASEASQTAAAVPPIDSGQAESTAGKAGDAAAVPGTEAAPMPELKPAPAETPPPPAAVATPPGSSPESIAPGPRSEAAARKSKEPPKPAPAVAPPQPEPVVAAPPVEAVPEPPAPAKPEIAPVTFKDVKVLVAQGDNLRDRDAILRLTGDQLSVLDRSGQTEIVSLPYASIGQVFYSRSKQPQWKGPDGKEARASVDLGKMSFFRGDRNWLILMTQSNTVFIRFESRDLQPILAAVQERTGLTVQR